MVVEEKDDLSNLCSRTRSTGVGEGGQSSGRRQKDLNLKMGQSTKGHSEERDNHNPSSHPLYHPTSTRDLHLRATHAPVTIDNPSGVFIGRALLGECERGRVGAH